MKQFTILFLILFCGGFSPAFAQETNEGLRNDLRIYEELMFEKKYDSLMHYVNPKLFDVVPKDALVSMFKSLLESDEVEIEIGNFEKNLILDVMEIEGSSYSFIEYSMLMNMTFPDGFEDDEEKEMMQNIMEMQFGKGNVEIEESTVKVNSKNAMFAEYVDGRWTFVTYKTEQRGLMDMLIPRKIQDEILKARYSEQGELEDK